MKSKIASLLVASDLNLYHIGPPLDLGPLPSFFYFALSGPDSLSKDPFNQPVEFLRGKMIRIFSLTLPGHEANLPPENAMHIWAEDLEKGTDTIANFLTSVEKSLEFALREAFCDPDKLGIGGLSRGGFLATHAAARIPLFKYLLGFAPLTRLSILKEFSAIKRDPKILSMDTHLLSPALADRKVRFYIGNRDTRVETRSCIDLALSIAEAAHARRIHSPQIECYITPSIGRDGHGTSPEIFQQGAEWMARCLESHV